MRLKPGKPGIRQRTVRIAPAPKGSDGAGWKNGTPGLAAHITLGYQKGASLFELANPPILLPLLIKIGWNVTGGILLGEVRDPADRH